MSKRPTLIGIDVKAAGLMPTQQECVKLLRSMLDDAEAGKIMALVVVACGPTDFGSAMAGTDAPRMLLGLEVAKIGIMDNVTGKRTVLHR